MFYKMLLLLSELEELCSTCNRCGMCQSVCPVFLETRHEADVARGKLSLIEGLSSEILNSPDKVLSRLHNCLLCGSCTSNCSRKVQTLEIFIKARIIITEYTGLSFFKRTILQKIIARPVIFNKTVLLLNKYQRFFFKSDGDNLRTIRPRLYNPFLKGRKLQSLAPETFHSQVNSASLKNGETSNTKIIYYAGCLIDKIMPEIGMASIKALTANKSNVLLCNTEGCCGMPALSSGDIKTFNMLVEHNVKIFSEKEFDYIVTACATCTYTLKKLWPVVYRGEFEKQVKSIAEKTIDITKFINNSDRSNPISEKDETNTPKTIVTIHDPCHLKKSLGIFSELRTLVKKNPDYKIHEMKNPDNCCGFGGTFNISNYAVSSKIGSIKCKDIEQTKAPIVATGCPACMLQLKDHLSETEVKHVIELYSDLI